jgi:hypothetical protein
MDMRKEGQDLSGDRPRKLGVLPCGSRVCLRCHRQCGVVMAAYLSGLDEKRAITEEDL